MAVRSASASAPITKARLSEIHFEEAEADSVAWMEAVVHCFRYFLGGDPAAAPVYLCLGGWVGEA